MLLAFLLGVRECRLTCTTHYENPDHAAAYESGRAWAHRLTGHHFDPT